jgi:hypothetical protein
VGEKDPSGKFRPRLLRAKCQNDPAGFFIRRKDNRIFLKAMTGQVGTDSEPLQRTAVEVKAPWLSRTEHHPVAAGLKADEASRPGPAAAGRYQSEALVGLTGGAK